MPRPTTHGRNRFRAMADHRQLPCQPLEPRRMLAGDFFVVNGTEGDDQIHIEVSGPLVVADVNGTVTSTPDADVFGILVNALGGNDQIALDSNSDNSTTLNGGAGDDRIILAPASQQMSDIEAFVMVNGDTGIDLLKLNDANETVGVNYQITAPFIGRSNGDGILPRVEQLDVAAGSGPDLLSLGIAGPVALNTGAGTDIVDITETGISGAGITMSPSTGDDVVGVNTDDSGVSTLTLVAQRLGSLTVHEGGRVRLVEAADTTVLRTGSLVVQRPGFLDVADNHVIVDYTGPSPLPAIRAALTGGYAGGAWIGGGINSSIAAVTGNTALGYAEASDIFTTFPATFVDQQVDDMAVLIRHTFYGDANLSGNVGLDDFNALAANFGMTGRQWFQGDFDFNGNVNLSDFNLLAENFGAARAGAGTSLFTGTRVTDDDSVEQV